MVGLSVPFVVFAMSYCTCAREVRGVVSLDTMDLEDVVDK